MQSTPKIFVLKSREIIYTLLLIFLALLLILCMILMFKGPKTRDQIMIQSESSTHLSESDPIAESYTPGIYTSAITLGENTLDVAVTVTQNRISSIQLINLSNSVAASFPLVSPAFDHLVSQILEKQSLDHITCAPENRYTSQMLFLAIEEALSLSRSIPNA